MVTSYFAGAIGRGKWEMALCVPSSSWRFKFRPGDKNAENNGLFIFLPFCPSICLQKRHSIHRLFCSSNEEDFHPSPTLSSEKSLLGTYFFVPQPTSPPNRAAVSIGILDGPSVRPPLSRQCPQPPASTISSSCRKRMEERNADSKQQLGTIQTLLPILAGRS